MLSEFNAAEIKFAGLGASGDSAAEAAERLAALLQQWSASHTGCRILQLSVLPSTPSNPGENAAAMAVVAYTEAALTATDAAEAVAAAVEEIHDAQLNGPPTPGEA